MRLTSLLSDYLSVLSRNSQYHLMCCELLSVWITLSAPHSPTERRWALIQYCDAIDIVFLQHYLLSRQDGNAFICKICEKKSFYLKTKDQIFLLSAKCIPYIFHHNSPYRAYVGI